jgi:virginiamycin B lyase
MRGSIARWSAVVITLLVAIPALAVSNVWHSIGPESEPNVHSLLIDPGSPTTIYAGAVGAIWRTEDAGKNWTHADTPETSLCEIRGLAVDPGHPSTLYAGCLGTIKSTDGGRTWAPMHNGMEMGSDLAVVWAVAIDPASTSTVYAATPTGFVFKAVDGGAHWQQTGPLPNAAREVRALVIDPHSSSTIYAGATAGGVFKSTNGGQSWISANTGVMTDEVTSLAIDPVSPSTIYAGTIGFGVFKSTDGAASWTEVFGPRNLNGQAFTVSELAVDPLNHSSILMTIGEPGGGVFQSTDSGATWHSYGTGLPDFVALRALAVAPSVVYVGSLDQYPGYVDGGVFALGAENVCQPPAGIADLSEFSVPTPNSKPLGIAAGPDCAVWFTESAANKIGRVTASGDITEFTVPTSSSGPSRIVLGPDGAMWFSESDANKIGRVTTGGTFTEFPVPTAGSFPLGVATGPDNNLWFIEMSGHKIGRLTPAGVITEFLVPPLGSIPSFPRSIVAGADGNLWFSELFTGRVGRVTTSGDMTMFTVEPSCCASLGEITAGPDGNVWVTEQTDNTIVRVTPAGTLTYFPLGHGGEGHDGKAVVFGIAPGADGALWFTTSSSFGRITTSGEISEFPLPNPNASPQIIAAGPDGGLWFTEMDANKIARKNVTSAAAPSRRRSVRH